MTEVTPCPKPQPRAKKRNRGRARPDVPLAVRCEICQVWRSTERHHKLRRSQGGTDDVTNTMDLCSWCHGEVHRNPEHSYREGYLIHGGAASDDRTNEGEEG